MFVRSSMPITFLQRVNIVLYSRHVWLDYICDEGGVGGGGVSLKVRLCLEQAV